MTHSHRFALLVAPLLCGLAACRSQPAEPAPPPASYELAIAPPGARGARAAGTDAAPPPLSAGEPAEQGADEPTEPEPEGDPADAGVQQDAAPGVAL